MNSNTMNQIINLYFKIPLYALNVHQLIMKHAMHKLKGNCVLVTFKFMFKKSYILQLKVITK